MSIESDIFDGLTGNASLAALIGTRVFPHQARGYPQDKPMPGVTYQQISAISNFTHSGLAPITEARFQFNAFGKTVLETNEVARRLRLAIQAIPRTKVTAMEGPRDGMDPEITMSTAGDRQRGQPWKSIDAFLWFAQQ